MFYIGNIPVPSTIWTTDSRIAFSIGSLDIYWYGIFVTIGFILAIILALIKLGAWYKVKVDPFYWFCLMGIPTAILGARIWSCCLGDANWDSFFNFSTGGLAIEGGVVFTALLGLWWFPFILKKPKYQVRDILQDPTKPQIKQVSTWVYVDAILPCILIGQIVGRWGNYFNQEVFGQMIDPSNTDYIQWLCNHLPFMYVSSTNPQGYPVGYYQPLFLYESCVNILGLLLIYVGMEFIPKLKSGTIGMTYFLWYGIVRIIFEPLRYSEFSFASTYVMTGIWIAISLALIILNQIGVISKTRNYRCKLYLSDKICEPIQKTFNKNCLNKINRKIKKFTSKNQNYELDSKLKVKYEKLVNKKDFYAEQAKQINQKYKINKSLYRREDKDKLYYLGR